MAQQIKKKFIGNDQIDSTKIKLLQNQAVRAVDSTGTEQELIKLGATDEVLVKGQEVGLKSAIDAEQSRAELEESSLQLQIDQEESRAMAEESSIRALISSSSTDQSQAVYEEQSRAEAAESALDSRLDVLEADPTTKTYVDEEVSGLQHQIDNVLSNLDPASLDSLTEIVSAFQAMDGELEGTISSLAHSSSEAVQAEQSRAELAESSLQSAITAEISNRMADVDAEQSRAELQESSLQFQISAEISRAELEESSLQSQISAEVSRAELEESSLQFQISQEQSRAEMEESSLQFQIDEEESRAMSAESALDSRLSSLEANPTTASYVNAQISSVQSSISVEQSRAELEESSLQAQIDQEESRATTAESSLQAQITAEISSRIVDVDAEESRATAIESSLQLQINEEESRALLVEAALQSDLDNLDGYAQDIRSDLDAEESRALIAEASLQAQISSSVSSEQSRALAAESSLQSSISSEQSSRIAAISAEESARSLADSLLSDRVDPIEDLLDFQKFHVYENNSMVFGSAKAPEADVNLRDGWYFKNAVAGEKIHWYFYDGMNQPSVSLGDFSAFAVMTFDSVKAPIMAAYTLPQGDGQDSESWYRSKKTFSQMSVTPVVGKKYLVFFGQNPAIHPELPRIELLPSASNTVGPLNSSEPVYLASFGSNSSDLVNSAQFMVESVGVNSPSFKDEVELRIRPASLAKLQAEESSRIAADLSLQTQISSSVGAEQSRAVAAEATLQDQIDSLLSNIDTEALDSLTEIVSAFQAADSSLQGAISLLAGNSSGNIEAEQSRAEAVESSLQAQITAEISSRMADVDAEQSRAEAVESSLQAQINEEESRAMAAEEALDSRLDVIEPKVSTLESEMDQAQTDISSLTSNKANKSLSNLDAVTAIPASVTNLQSESTVQNDFALEFKIDTKAQTASNSGSIRTISGDVAGNFVSGGGRVGSGLNSNASRPSASSSATGTVSMVSGNITGGTRGATGNASLASGSITVGGITGNTGSANIITGYIEDGSTGTSGRILVESGFNYNSVSGRSGGMFFGSGKSATGKSGDVRIYTGEIGTFLTDNSPNTSGTGQILVESGPSVNVGASGPVLLRSGNNSSSGNSGDVTIESGSVVSGVRGKVSVSARVVEMNTVLDMQSNRIIDLADPISAQEAATKAYVDSQRPIFNKESFVVGSNSIGATHVDLAHEADAMSLVVFVGRLALHKDEDYTLSVESGVTRITWTGSFGSGGDEEVANGDKIFVTYSR